MASLKEENFIFIFFKCIKLNLYLRRVIIPVRCDWMHTNPFWLYLYPRPIKQTLSSGGLAHLRSHLPLMDPLLKPWFVHTFPFLINHRLQATIAEFGNHAKLN